MQRNWMVTCTALVLLLALGTGRAGAATFEVMALTGGAAPGPEGGPYLSFDDARIDAEGRVLFACSIRDPATMSGEDAAVLWPGMGASVLLARRNDPAPGIPGARFLRVADDDYLLLSERGVGIGGRLIVEGTVTEADQDVLWSENASGALVPVAREGDSAPGVPGATFRSVLPSYPRHGGSGWSFPMQLLPGATSSLFGESSAFSVELLALEGDVAAGIGPSTFSSFSDVIAANDLGDLLFDASATDGVTTSRGLWVEDDTGMRELVLLHGDPAPGIQSATFQSLNTSQFGFNDARDIALRATVVGPGIDASNDQGLWGPDGVGGLRLLAREGDVVPGAPLETFTGLWVAAVDGSGGVVLEAQTSGTTSGLWYAPLGGALERVAAIGSPVPGLPGVSFSSIAEWDGNSLGQLVFEAGYVEMGEFKEAVWRHDGASGVTQLVARRGDTVEVAPGDTRSIEGIELSEEKSGGQDGRPSGWNDAGQLAVVLRFAGGAEGVARITVPEALGGSWIALASLAVLASGVARRMLPG